MRRWAYYVETTPGRHARSGGTVWRVPDPKGGFRPFQSARFYRKWSYASRVWYGRNIANPQAYVEDMVNRTGRAIRWERIQEDEVQDILLGIDPMTALDVGPDCGF